MHLARAIFLFFSSWKSLEEMLIQRFFVDTLLPGEVLLRRIQV